MTSDARLFTLVLAAGLFAGCGTSDAVNEGPSAPPELPLPYNMAVERSSPNSIWLPEPGESTKVPLRPRADAARKRGLELAGKKDWAGAIAAFEEARASAHCAPSVIFNLALAHQRAGHPVQAAMWYRAWLVMEDGAPNSEDVRTELTRQITAAESRALALFEEAERLANALSQDPPAKGGRSLRQTALEEIAFVMYAAGLEDRANAVFARAQALPGAAEVVEKRTYWDRHGLFGATWCWDTKRIEEILARHGDEYEPGLKADARVKAAWARGDLDRVSELLASNPDYAARSMDWGLPTRAYGQLEVILGRNFRSPAAEKEFDGEWYHNALLAASEAAFWDGRSDVARRLAVSGRDYYRKRQLAWYRQGHGSMDAEFNGGSPGMSHAYNGGPHTWHYILTCAILGDWPAIQEELRRWKDTSTIEGYPLGCADEPCGRAAMLLYATLPRSESPAAIERLMQWSAAAGPGEVVGAENVEREHWFPMACFALDLARGDANAAVKPLRLNMPDDPESQNRAIRALRVCASRGHTTVAVWIAKQVHEGDVALLALNRLARERASTAEDLKSIEDFSMSVSGGWRPRNPASSVRVWRYLRQAAFLADHRLYELGPEMDEVAKTTPDRLPGRIAGLGFQILLGVHAARLDD